ncbi:conserved hypothetical protein [Magnetospirillum sp. LM-5]|uniref:DUF6624 domain-containing protein n=1 Tax=Magnetospirillum sp. LM-5 TaxID=2681466 RepID=UPI00138395F8|nr:DUF6624 domain-containing protein [Magnetospirillum sp. LM-5]CAA7621125.1 conserved hypothetical protein [Magnetospirillum sp. LM-5]
MRDHLLQLAEQESKLRHRLALSGELLEGYHPEIRAIHEANARELELAIDDEGWPTADEIGDDALEAAFLIALNAMSRPSFQRRCLTHMKMAANRGEIPARHAAMLEDRIRVLEGRPQIYGTQLDWDEDGHLAPLPIDAEESLDQRRAKVGLPPLAQALAQAEAEAAASQEHPAAEWLHRQHALADFAHEVGWR